MPLIECKRVPPVGAIISIGSGRRKTKMVGRVSMVEMISTDAWFSEVGVRVYAIILKAPYAYRKEHFRVGGQNDWTWRQGWWTLRWLREEDPCVGCGHERHPRRVCGSIWNLGGPCGCIVEGA